ncbi:putative ribonuclease H-like domain-containing protein, partial [Tanacetum coccineum]
MFDSSLKISSDDEPQPSSNAKRRMTKVSATLEATHADLFGDETEMDMSNLTTSYQVPSTPNTRIHKDHSLDHEEPKRIAKALSDPAWVEAMQEEILQFILQKEVYVCQPLGFEDPDYPDKVYKVVKAFYGLHQAPRA